MTHFGKTIIKEKPYLLAKALKEETGSGGRGGL